MRFLETVRGDGPVILAFPHTGTDVPEDIEDSLSDNGRMLADTDWHIDRLYDGLIDNATTVRTRIHRYVIDVNRDPDGQSLYPGQNTTHLVPLTDFDGEPIWRDANTVDNAEIARRTQAYHKPYHDALAAEVARVKSIHGYAILYDCHSIRSHIPFLFDGVLPDLNVGTNNGATCADGIERAVVAACQAAPDYSSVLNGRFKGGWTTRNYGHPHDGIHAIQMELAQSTYLSDESPPWVFDEDKAANLRAELTKILHPLLEWRPA